MDDNLDENYSKIKDLSTINLNDGRVIYRWILESKDQNYAGKRYKIIQQMIIIHLKIAFNFP